jgi:uncharacterized protein
MYSTKRVCGIVINIKILKKKDLKGYTLIEGFPGLGLVGPMAISYIIDKLGMEYIGYLESDDFPPLISIHHKTPMPPIRVYVNDKYKIVTIFAEFAMPMELIYPLSNSVYKFVKDNSIAKIFSMGGIPKLDGKDIVYVMASTPELVKSLEKSGFKPIEEGVATGISALLLTNSTQDKLPDVSLLVPIIQNIIDPKYAELAIKSLNTLLHLDIDTTELEKEARLVEAKIQELIKKHTESHENYKQAITDSGPSMYA